MRRPISALFIFIGMLCARSLFGAVGDIYVTGGIPAGEAGLYRIDPVTGTQHRVIDVIDSPNGVAIDPSGAPLMVNTFVNQVWRYDPTAQTYTTFQLTTDSLFQGWTIATDPSGKYYVEGTVINTGDGTTRSAVDVVDPGQGNQQLLILGSGSGVHGVLSIARTPNHQTLLAGDNLYRVVAPDSTAVVSPGPLPGGVAVGPDGTIYGAAGNQVVRIDAATGVRTVVSTDGFLTQPIALAVDPQGNIDVVDTYLGGSIIRVNAQDGSQAVVSSGGILGETSRDAIAIVMPEPVCWAPFLAGFTFLISRRGRLHQTIQR